MTTATTLGQFVEVYFEDMRRDRLKRESTLVSYESNFARHLGPECGHLPLAEITTAKAQRALSAIAERGLRHSSVSQIRSLFLDIMGHAIRSGVLVGTNPIRETKIPSTVLAARETHAYTAEEASEILRRLSGQAKAVVAIAAYAGLRRSEIQGLDWNDYQEENSGMVLKVQRGNWNGEVTATKTAKSRASVPVMRPLKRILDAYYVECGSPESGPMFATSEGTPQRLNNLLERMILPALVGCSVKWRGWHAFRRGLASELNTQGTPDLTIQRVLRHSNVETTRRCYIKVSEPQSREALNRLAFALYAE